MIEGIIFESVNKWPYLGALLMASIMLPMGLLAVIWKTWKMLVAMVVVGVLFIVAIPMWWPQTTKPYPVICKQIDGKVYCVLKKGRIHND